MNTLPQAQRPTWPPKFVGNETIAGGYDEPTGVCEVRQLQVPQGLSELETARERLIKVGEALIIRLKCVTVPQPVQKSDKSSPRPARCELAERLFQEAETIHSVAEILEQLTAQIEL